MVFIHLNTQEIPYSSFSWFQEQYINSSIDCRSLSLYNFSDSLFTMYISQAMMKLLILFLMEKVVVVPFIVVVVERDWESLEERKSDRSHIEIESGNNDNREVFNVSHFPLKNSVDRLSHSYCLFSPLFVWMWHQESRKRKERWLSCHHHHQSRHQWNPESKKKNKRTCHSKTWTSRAQMHRQTHTIQWQQNQEQEEEEGKKRENVVRDRRGNACVIIPSQERRRLKMKESHSYYWSPRDSPSWQTQQTLDKRRTK